MGDKEHNNYFVEIKNDNSTPLVAKNRSFYLIVLIKSNIIFYWLLENIYATEPFKLTQFSLLIPNQNNIIYERLEICLNYVYTVIYQRLRSSNF